MVVLSLSAGRGSYVYGFLLLFLAVYTIQHMYWDVMMYVTRFILIINW